MTIHIKICGITDGAGADAAVEAGVDAVGFVFADSVRRLTPAQATAIASNLPDDLDRVAVFLRPSMQEVTHVLERFDAQLVQADHSALARLTSFPRLPVFRESPTVIAEIGAYTATTSSRRFLYEGPRSGVGRKVDHTGAREAAVLGRMTVAGGLDPDNVGEVIRAIRPFGVDVSSGVESRPGVKDPGRIRAFVEAVREIEEELVPT